jgi:hypothetical protein
MSQFNIELMNRGLIIKPQHAANLDFNVDWLACFDIQPSYVPTIVTWNINSSPTLATTGVHTP